ncbi:MAG TPA: hypothetical protein DCY20_09035 [Firmicutes bacterium]|nr:hypothetical protein [Bacillota bacterium]
MEKRNNLFSTWSQLTDSKSEYDFTSDEVVKSDRNSSANPMDTIGEATANSHVALEEDGRVSIVTVKNEEEFLAAIVSHQINQIHLHDSIDLSNRMNQVIDLAVDGMQIFGHGHCIYVPSCNDYGMCLNISGRHIELENVVIEAVKRKGRLKSNALTITGSNVLLNHVVIQNADRAAVYVYEAMGVRLENVTLIGQATAHFYHQVGLSINASDVYVHNLCVDGNATGVSVVCGHHPKTGEIKTSGLHVSGYLKVNQCVTQIKAQTAKGALIMCDDDQVNASATLSGVTTYRVNEMVESNEELSKPTVKKMNTLSSIAYKQLVTVKDEDCLTQDVISHVQVSEVEVKNHVLGQIKVSFVIDKSLNLSLLSRDNLIIDAIDQRTGDVLKSKNKTWLEYMYDEDKKGYGVGSKIKPGTYFAIFSSEQLQRVSPENVVIKITANLDGVKVFDHYEVECIEHGESRLAIQNEKVRIRLSSIPLKWLQKTKGFALDVISGEQVVPTVDFIRDT